ncbi:hypothetical protein [Erwinia sp. E_sp_B01_9]|uniref:hypothetical protein n=1 Tax=Erwinia sp. E_sp_B01_9 TaxID=3039403 RepID=UPI003D9B6D79
MSLLEEIGHFLLPGNDAIQLTFFTLIALSILLCVILVWRNARQSNWQRNWQQEGNNGEQAGLTTEHGSVPELSHAVATNSEKMANIMPGMLLILGLLGTFLGLGLALDKASAILHNSGTSAGAMDSSMQDLMDMMQGLGTKFKTSTWGIIAFLLLKGWEALNGFEARRLNWCIQRVQALQQESQEQLRAEQQFAVVREETHRNALAKSMVAAFNDQTSALCEEFSAQAKRAEESEAQRHQYQIAVLGEIAQINEQSRVLLETYISNNDKNLVALKQAASTMSTASQQVAGSASSLQQVVDTLGSELSVVMEGVRKELGEVVNAMSADFNRNIQQMGDQLATSGADMQRTLAQIEGALTTSIGNMDRAFGENMTNMASSLTVATDDISRSVNRMPDQIDRTMTMVGEQTEKSGKIQRTAMEQFMDSSDVLNVNVQEMTGFIKKVTGEIEQGLRAVSTSNQHTQTLLKRFGDIAEAQQNLPQVLTGISGSMDALTQEALSLRRMATEQRIEAMPVP